jgi:hypothetical protein
MATLGASQVWALNQDIHFKLEQNHVSTEQHVTQKHHGPKCVNLGGIAGGCHGRALRGHNDTRFGQPTHGQPISCPGVGHPQGIFGVFSYYWLVMLFINMVCLTVALASDFFFQFVMVVNVDPDLPSPWYLPFFHHCTPTGRLSGWPADCGPQAVYRLENDQDFVFW